MLRQRCPSTKQMNLRCGQRIIQWLLSVQQSIQMDLLRREFSWAQMSGKMWYHLFLPEEHCGVISRGLGFFYLKTFEPSIRISESSFSGITSISRRFFIEILYKNKDPAHFFHGQSLKNILRCEAFDSVNIKQKWRLCYLLLVNQIPEINLK